MQNEDYKTIMELSSKYPISTLCTEMGVNRSGFYKWMNRLNKPSTKEQRRLLYIEIFTLYHDKYPSHGYRWLKAKIKLDLGESISFICLPNMQIRTN